MRSQSFAPHQVISFALVNSAGGPQGGAKFVGNFLCAVAGKFAGTATSATDEMLGSWVRHGSNGYTNKQSSVGAATQPRP
jgi:hypothetical protein